MRLSLGLLIAIGFVSGQFELPSAVDDLLQQAEDGLNEFLEENPELDFFDDDDDYLDDNEISNDDDYEDYDDENYDDEDYDDEDYDDENYEDEDYGDEDYDGEDYDGDYYDYADWYEEWEGVNWEDYWDELVDAVYEFFDWASYEFGLDEEDWNNLFDYYYDGYYGF